MKMYLRQFLPILFVLLSACAPQGPVSPTVTPFVMPGTSTPVPPRPTNIPEVSHSITNKVSTPISTMVPPLSTPTPYDGIKINSVKYQESDCRTAGKLYVVALGAGGPSADACLPVETTSYGAFTLKATFEKNSSIGDDPNTLYLKDLGDYNWMNSSALYQMDLPAGDYALFGFCDDICEITVKAVNGYDIGYFEVESVGDFSFTFNVAYDFTADTTPAEVLVEHIDNGGGSLYYMTISPAGSLETTP